MQLYNNRWLEVDVTIMIETAPTCAAYFLTRRFNHAIDAEAAVPHSSMLTAARSLVLTHSARSWTPISMRVSIASPSALNSVVDGVVTEARRFELV